MKIDLSKEQKEALKGYLIEYAEHEYLVARAREYYRWKFADEEEELLEHVAINIR